MENEALFIDVEQQQLIGLSDSTQKINGGINVFNFTCVNNEQDNQPMQIVHQSLTRQQP
jgi:hypothetical protein